MVRTVRHTGQTNDSYTQLAQSIGVPKAVRAVASACAANRLAALYPQDRHFRTRVVMARHGFGLDEYKYFGYPLPPLVDALRVALYPHLAPIANRWNQALGNTVQYPDTLQAFLRRCHAAGQTRPTPLLLQYGEHDYNCLHQDVYGEHVFPLQAAALLSRPGQDFTGGEFVMTESSPEGQRAHVTSMRQGDLVIFTVNQRPTEGRQGRMRKTTMPQGVSRLQAGRRHTLGMIFHDAR